MANVTKVVRDYVTMKVKDFYLKKQKEKVEKLNEKYKSKIKKLESNRKKIRELDDESLLIQRELKGSINTDDSIAFYGYNFVGNGLSKASYERDIVTILAKLETESNEVAMDVIIEEVLE